MRPQLSRRAIARLTLSASQRLARVQTRLRRLAAGKASMKMPPSSSSCGWKLHQRARCAYRRPTPSSVTSRANGTELRARLLEGLARSWPQVGALPLDFDGKAFHKPGGVAPQLEWDAKAQHMTMIYYSGKPYSVRVRVPRQRIRRGFRPQLVTTIWQRRNSRPPPDSRTPPRDSSESPRSDRSTENTAEHDQA